MTLAPFWEDREVTQVAGNGATVWLAFKATHCRDAMAGNTIPVSKETVEGIRTKVH